MSNDLDPFRPGGEGEARAERVEARLRQLGTREPRCSRAGCDETDPFALSGVAPALVCHECRAIEEGWSWMEDHHVSGRANSPVTVAVPANDHAVLSEFQRAWDGDTLRNPDGSPLLRAAAALRGWVDVLRLIIERSVGWVAPMLEALDAWLRERVGPRWWEEFSWPAS